MWWGYWVAILVVLAVVVAVAFVFYRGYNRVKPKPLEGFPAPPMNHPFGHIDKMLSPIKHINRKDVCEAARCQYHQLVMMKQASVFANDPAEIGRLLGELRTKGPIYAAFRFDPKVPDLFASDGDDYALRSKALRSSLLNLKMSAADVTAINNSLEAAIKAKAESAEPLDCDALFSLAAMDFVCKALFRYDLNAVGGSEEGTKLYRYLKDLAKDIASKSVYKHADNKPVGADILKTGNDHWKTFLRKMLALIQSSATEYRSKHGSLKPDEDFGHALVTLAEANESFGELQLIAEIHQAFRHSHETIAGTLMWVFYALAFNPKVRCALEVSLSEAQPTESSEYLECVIKETFRKYPVQGNMTVRTIDKEDYKIQNVLVPKDTPIHLHMWSQHNVQRSFKDANVFQPDRWKADQPDTQFPNGATLASYPKCPYMTSMHASAFGGSAAEASPVCPSLGRESVYEGAGHADGSLCYYPFSAGDRSCPAKGLVLQVIRSAVAHIAMRYRLMFVESSAEEDPGESRMFTIVPITSKSTLFKAERLTPADIGKLPDEGWADEDDDEDQYQNITMSDAEED
jgi:cytochrome P450